VESLLFNGLKVPSAEVVTELRTVSSRSDISSC